MRYDPKYTKSKNGMFYAVAEDDRGCNVKPYCVMAYNGTRGFAQQVSRWYFHKGWAVRAWRKIVGE